MMHQEIDNECSGNIEAIKWEKVVYEIIDISVREAKKVGMSGRIPIFTDVLMNTLKDPGAFLVLIRYFREKINQDKAIDKEGVTV